MIALLSIFAKLLLYLGVTIVIGDLTLRMRQVFALAGSLPAAQRAIARYGWTAVAIALPLLLLAQVLSLELEATRESYGLLLVGTSWGHGWLALLVATVVGCGAFAFRWAVPLQALTVAALSVTVGGLGHAAADESWPMLSRAVDGVHVAAVGAWIGGLALLARFAPHEHQGEAWARYSRVATIAAPFVLLSGMVSSLRRLVAVPTEHGVVAALSTVLSASYGRLLLVKIVLALVVLGYGARHRQRIAREEFVDTRRVRAELVFALLVFGVTALLTGSAPPGE
ncbi:MAG TPA: CopD family protein [Gemmatimonas sp.]|nr:CopD family protein [Gemmatimonas sp.]